MVSFECDYTTGCHPKILERYMETNLDQQPGYGKDKFTVHAEELIKDACKSHGSEVHFIVSGTQANKVAIAALLEDYEGIIAPTSGHVSVHEAGAIEDSGHKVIELQEKNGKISASQIDEYVTDFYNDGSWQQMVIPGLVYITLPTEFGTLYTLSELIEISNVCKKHNMRLFVDGARLSLALASDECDITLPDLAKLADCFTIGSTKSGAMLGEALVFREDSTPKNFITTRRKHGALLAKGRVIGISFETLFTDNLYIEIGKKILDTSKKLRDVLHKNNCKFFLESPTNQQFIILENSVLKALNSRVAVTNWDKFDEQHRVVRLVASWSTSDQDLNALDGALSEII